MFFSLQKPIFQLINLGDILSTETAPTEPSTEETEPIADEESDSTKDIVEEDVSTISLGVALNHSIFVAFVAVLVSFLA